VRISRADMLGPDGGGFDLALGEILPWFVVLSGAFCLGLVADLPHAGNHGIHPSCVAHPETSFVALT